MKDKSLIFPFYRTENTNNLKIQECMYYKSKERKKKKRKICNCSAAPFVTAAPINTKLITL